MSDFTREIAEHEQLEQRITSLMERTTVRSHRIELQRQLAAVQEDLRGMRQHQWLAREAQGPWLSKD